MYKKMLLVMLAAGNMAQAMQQAKNKKTDMEAKSATAAALVAQQAADSDDDFGAEVAEDSAAPETTPLHLSGPSGSAGFGGQADAFSPAPQEESKRSAESKAAGDVSSEQKKLMDDKAGIRLAGQKQQAPASLFTRAWTKVCDEMCGQGSMVLGELQKGTLRHSGEPGSEIRRVDRGLNDFCKSRDHRSIRETLKLAHEQGINPSADTKNRIAECLADMQKKFIKDLFGQTMNVVHELEVIQECDAFVSKGKSKKLQADLLKFLCAEMLKEFIAEQARIAEKEKTDSKD